MKIFNQLKFLLIIAIVLNLLILVLNINNSKNNLRHFKKHLVDYSNFILKTFESGNRLLMMQKREILGATFRSFVEEISKNENVKNLIIFNDENLDTIFSLKEPTKYELYLIREKKFETKNELIVHREITAGHRMGGRMRMHMMEGEEEQKFNAYVIMDLSSYNSIKKNITVNILFIIVSEIILLIITISLFKIFKNYLKTQENLKKAEKDAELGKFANILAHEIKNPLSSIKGLIEYSANREESSKLKEYLGRSLQEIERLNKIVNDFLHFGRDIVLNNSNFDVKELIFEALKVLKYDIEEKNLTAEVDGKSFEINGDRDKIFQVIINLMINAIHASPTGEKITVKIDSIERSVTFVNNVYEDNIDIDKIFEPFYTTKAKGSGLGLSIAKKIVELHNGKVVVKRTKPFEIAVIFGK
jgi:two-component system sensor histidine kinase HydH